MIVNLLLLQASFNHEVNLTDLDKVYLLLAEENLKDSFNVLCYDLQIRSLADLNKLDEEKLKRFRLLPNFAKDRLRQLPEKAKTTDFVHLAKVVVHFVCIQLQAVKHSWQHFVPEKYPYPSQGRVFLLLTPPTCLKIPGSLHTFRIKILDPTGPLEFATSSCLFTIIRIMAHIGINVVKQ